MQTAAEKPADGRRLAHLSAGPSFKFTAQQQAEGKNELSWLGQPQALSLLNLMTLSELEQGTQKRSALLDGIY